MSSMLQTLQHVLAGLRQCITLAPSLPSPSTPSLPLARPNRFPPPSGDHASRRRRCPPELACFQHPSLLPFGQTSLPRNQLLVVMHPHSDLQVPSHDPPTPPHPTLKKGHKVVGKPNNVHMCSHEPRLHTPAPPHAFGWCVTPPACLNCTIYAPNQALQGRWRAPRLHSGCQKGSAPFHTKHPAY
jgi:hypothetical protein